jgi:metalloendopeptidase OMA1, mitochondrial
MKRIHWIPLLLLAACATVPVTGRKSLRLVPEGQELALGEQSYQEILKTAKLSPDAAANAMLRRVGERIAKVSDRKDFKWEYSLIDDPKTVNAFCLPGGKVAFYTGILPVTQTEAGMAVVMGHEVAHAIAKHGAERISQQMLLSVGEVSLAVAMREKPRETQSMALAAYGLGSVVGVALPFGRSQESEADHIGLIYMARAGYDPREAVTFWQRMSKSGEGHSQPPEFLSTHPNHDRRIRDLEKWMPEAVAEYEKSSYR